MNGVYQRLRLSLAVLALTAATPLVAGGKVETFIGQVSDAMCGAAHMEPGTTPADCTRTCFSKGAKFALVVGDKVYSLEGENKTALDELGTLAGEKAKITGTVRGDTIQVSSVAASK